MYLIPRFLLIVSSCLLLQQSSAEDCEWWSRSDGLACAHACLNSYIGRCPREIVTFFGRLKNEQCQTTEIASVMPVLAGPCGVIHFVRYDRPPPRIIRHNKMNVTPLPKSIWSKSRLLGALQSHK